MNRNFGFTVKYPQLLPVAGDFFSKISPFSATFNDFGVKLGVLRGILESKLPGFTPGKC